MKWGRNTDYHGSRTYALDPPPEERRPPRMIWTRFATAAGYLAARIHRRRSAAPSTVVLVNGRERHFSMLGAKRSAIGISRSSAVKWPFPLEEGFDG